MLLASNLLKQEHRREGACEAPTYNSPVHAALGRRRVPCRAQHGGAAVGSSRGVPLPWHAQGRLLAHTRWYMTRARDTTETCVSKAAAAAATTQQPVPGSQLPRCRKEAKGSLLQLLCPRPAADAKGQADVHTTEPQPAPCTFGQPFHTMEATCRRCFSLAAALRREVGSHQLLWPMPLQAPLLAPLLPLACRKQAAAGAGAEAHRCAPQSPMSCIRMKVE